MEQPLTIVGYPHQADGSAYYRFYQPFEKLAQYGRHRVVLPSPELASEGLAFEDEQLDEIDMIVGQRWMYDAGVNTMTKWSKRTNLVYECDDDILNPDSVSGLAHLYDPKVKESIKTCLGLAAMVTVSTGPLAEEFSKYNDMVRVIPNCVDGDVLFMDRTKNDRLTVGWSGGMSHLEDWVDKAADPVGRVLNDHADTVDMHFVGIDYSPLLRFKARYTPWTTHVWTFFKTIDFDIGLAPLADSQFNRCKSHIRALEYMALGIPVLASDVPAYRDLVVDGVTGYLVNTPDEWADRLTELIEDESMRDEMGAKGRDVASQHVIQRGWKNWQSAYEELS